MKENSTKEKQETKKETRVEKIRVGDLKYGFGNPRKISKKKEEELRISLETLTNFGVFCIDENNNVFTGNQRSKILNSINPDTIVDVKRLIGYSTAELKAINIKDNTHSGEFDVDALADWTADLTMDFGLDDIKKDKDVEERSIPEMELIHYEKYDYVMIACRSQLDYNDLVRKLGIEGKKVAISKRKINARAIWYDKMQAQVVPNDLYEKYVAAYEEKMKKEEKIKRK